MPIVIRLGEVLATKKLRNRDLARLLETSEVNVSNIRNGHIKGVRFSMLEKMCQVLRCKPGDIIDYVPPQE